MEKLNIAELLKDCPKGMELDCTMYDDCEFLDVDTLSDTYLIRIKTPCGIKYLDKYGCYTINPKSKCVIFPKGKTTWEGFERPFKDGDIVYVETRFYNYIIIYKKLDECLHRYVNFSNEKYFYYGKDGNGAVCTKDEIQEIRLATEEEKEKLFQAIKVNGYRWNAEKKELEKLIEPKFKAGDVIQSTHTHKYKVKITEVNVEDECYEYESIIAKGIGGIAFSEQDDWKLVPTKFDISNLRPFDKVLVRQNVNGKWGIDFFGFYTEGFYYTTGSAMYVQCVPYKDNEHLCGTTNDCNDFYKSW